MDSSPAVLSANVQGEAKKEDKMGVIASLIQYMKLRRVQNKQKQQKRTVLHMLAASGVVRPGHIELRYTRPFARSTARRA